MAIILGRKGGSGGGGGTPSGPAGGDLDGTYPNPTIAADVVADATVVFDHTVSVAGGTLDSNTILGGAIPGTYANLKLTFVGRSNRAANTSDTFHCRFNNDSGNNYDTQYNQVDAAGAFTSADANASSAIGPATAPLALIPAASSASGLSASYGISLPGYSGTTFHKGLISSGQAALDTADIRQWNCVGVWRSTAAITRVQLIMANGQFLAGSRWILMGEG